MTFRELFNREPSKDESDARSGARVISEKLREYKWSAAKKRSGVRRTKRRPKKARNNFLTALLHAPMRDWASLRAEATDKLAAQRKAMGQSPPSPMLIAVALGELLRRQRNKRKAARRLEVSP